MRATLHPFTKMDFCDYGGAEGPYPSVAEVGWQQLGLARGGNPEELQAVLIVDSNGACFAVTDNDGMEFATWYYAETNRKRAQAAARLLLQGNRLGHVTPDLLGALGWDNQSL